MPRKIIHDNIQYTHYDLTFTPDLKNFTFMGQGKITIDVTEEVDQVQLNSKELVITFCEFNVNDQKIIPTNISYDKESQRVIFTLPSKLPIGKGLLTMDFEGILNDQMAGFYRTKYTDKNGQETFGATTQFEATDARRAFPCVDEPARKATFDITLIVPKDKITLSNMEILSETDFNDDSLLKVVKFKTTPIMSTYLLAFYVGETDYLERIITKPLSGDPLRVRVYTPPGKKEQGQFALDNACDVIPFYSKYFDIDFPLDKIDMIGLTDFATGAMENWGLITYRSIYILDDPETSSFTSRLNIALTVSHELAHQWFGNLVTMEWWSDLWLNEGFATWIEWVATDHFFPEWNVWETFVEMDYTEALKLDQLDNSHAIENGVEDATHVDEIFDIITYQKGCCVIRMLANHLGSETFKKGLQLYLKRHMYQNTTTQDLWNALSEVSGKNINIMMDSWIQKVGYPIVHVSLESDDKIKINQSRYGMNKKNVDASDWIIPLDILDSECCYDELMVQPSSTFTMSNEWCKLNHDQSAFCRTQYNSKFLEKLFPLVQNKTLNTIDRHELISNLFAFAVSGHGSIIDALEFLDAYKNEDSYLVLSVILKYLGDTLTLWRESPSITKKIKEIILSIIDPMIEKLGWESKENETSETKQLRTLVIEQAGLFGHTETVVEAFARLLRYLAGHTYHLNSDMRSVAFNIMMDQSNKELFDDLIKLYIVSDSDLLRSEILRALGSVKDRELFEKAFNFAFNSQHVRTQDSLKVLAYISNQNVYYAWELIEKHWDRLCEIYKGGAFLFGRVVSFVLEKMFSMTQLGSASNFLQSKPDDTKSMKQTIDQALEDSMTKISWKIRDSDLLIAFCEK